MGGPKMEGSQPSYYMLLHVLWDNKMGHYHQNHEINLNIPSWTAPHRPD